MMVQKNIEMQLQAIRIIQERNGKVLNLEIELLNAFCFFSFDYSDSIMVLSVAALYKFISSLKICGWLKRFKNVIFLISVCLPSQRKQTRI